MPRHGRFERYRGFPPAFRRWPEQRRLLHRHGPFAPLSRLQYTENRLQEKFKTTLHAHLCIQRRLGYVGIHSQKLPAVVKEILLLILEMHRRNMVHFDIKPRNILVAEDGRMALTDPAFCHTFQERKPVGEMPFKGTTFFMAPEILRGFEVDDARPADMYSLGMTIAMARGVVSLHARHRKCA